MAANSPARVPAIPLATAIRVWAKVGCLGFGGPVGQIALLHREVVDERGWVTNEDFQHALSFCLLLPGPEAQQLATYLGWQLHGRLGGIIAGTLFWLPGAVLLWGIAWLYVTAGHHVLAIGVSNGLRAAVVALVAAALWRMTRHSLTNHGLRALAAAALGARLLGVPFPVILLAAALTGTWLARLSAEKSTPGTQRLQGAPPSPGPPAWETAGATAIWLAIWWLPLLGIGRLLGWEGRMFQLGRFFSWTSLVTFGGAYAVLPYVSQHATTVDWVTQGELLDGLALGETTPGPLVLVLQWIGFLAGWKQPGPLTPLASATLAAIITTWATFAPSFLWIFAVAPWMNRLRSSTRLSGALRGIQASVIGILATLAGQLARHAYLPNGTNSPIDYGAILLGLWALVELLHWRRPAHWIIAVCAAVGGVRSLV